MLTKGHLKSSFSLFFFFGYVCLGFYILGFRKRQESSFFFSSRLSKSGADPQKKNAALWGKGHNKIARRHGSARERGTKGTSLFLSLSLSLERRKRRRRRRRAFEQQQQQQRVVALQVVLFFSSNNTRERVHHLFPDAFKHSLVFPLSLSFKSHRARPRKDGQSLGDSTVRALVLYLLASDDALVFSRARASGPTPRDFGREREKGLKIFEFSPPLCVSLSQFFPNIESKIVGGISLSPPFFL